MGRTGMRWAMTRPALPASSRRRADQDLGGGVQAGHRDRVGGGAQGGGDGHLVAVGDLQSLGERAEHAGEPGGVGEQGRGGVGAAAGGLGQHLGPRLEGGQLAG